MSTHNNQPEIIAIEVYLERRKSRELVGRLSKIKAAGKFNFEFKYEEDYLLRKNAIPLGPEFPLSQEKFVARKLFPSFEDRLPSKKNPAYAEYCKSVAISPEELNPLILLSTIGRRGPSSFVFEAVREDTKKSIDVASYRKGLGLTIREFAAIFNASVTSIQKVEHSTDKGTELIKRLQIYINFPEVARWEASKNKAKIHDDKYRELQRRLAMLS